MGTVPYEVSLRAANDRPYLRRHMCIILDSMKKIRRGDHWSPVKRENRKNVEPPLSQLRRQLPLMGAF